MSNALPAWVAPHARPVPIRIGRAVHPARQCLRPRPERRPAVVAQGIPRRGDVRRLRHRAPLRSQPRRPRDARARRLDDLAAPGARRRQPDHLDARAWRRSRAGRSLSAAHAQSAAVQAATSLRTRRMSTLRRTGDRPVAPARRPAAQPPDTPRRPGAMAVVIDFAEFVVPRGDAAQLGGPFAANVVKVLGWANDPAILQANIVTVLHHRRAADLNPLVAENPHAAEIRLPLPGEAEMAAYLDTLARSQMPELAAQSRLDASRPRAAAHRPQPRRRQTSRHDGAQAGQRLTADWVTKVKKGLIESECQGLLDFIESSLTLDHIAGSEPVKAWLREDARAAPEGRAPRAADGVSHCRPHRDGQDVSWCSAGRASSASPASSSRTSAIGGWAPPSRTSRRSSRCSRPSAR